MIKVGGEVHFLLPITFNIKNSLCIATEEVKFTNAKNLAFESANANAMILVNFLQYILRLEDVEKNEGNYGQNSDGKLVVALQGSRAAGLIRELNIKLSLFFFNAFT